MKWNGMSKILTNHANFRNINRIGKYIIHIYFILEKSLLALMKKKTRK